jgi:serine/threonine-protein kinase
VIRTEGRLEPDRAAQIAAGTAAALSNAHRHGVVHRDVKPGNILLDDQGRVKVTDFGIARAGDPKENLTQTGVVMGTATYFSPEQAQGLPIDQRTDVYSLGVVLYEMVTGRPPFAGETPVSIAYKHVKEDPVPPREVEPSVPEDFEAIVLTAMEKDREDRYPTAEELRADLIRFARGQTPKAVRVRQVLAGPAVAAGAGAALAGVAAAEARTTATPLATAEPTVALPTNGPVGRAGGLPPPPVSGPPAPPLPPRGPDPEEGRPPRTKLFVGLSLGLLAILLVLLFLLARLLGFGGSSGGTDQVTVDDVTNKTFEDADRLLRAKGFLTLRQDQPDDSAPSGTVVSQNPKGGDLADKGTQVTLFVAVATGKVQVPALVNLKQDEAETALKAAGLVPVVQQVKNTSVGEGFVFEQDPVARTEVDKGSNVTIKVSTGDGLPPVPDVVNLSVLEATNRLTAAGFKTKNIDENSPTVPTGIVTRTDPPAGGKLAKGDLTVTVYVSRGAPTTTAAKVAVPSVIGLDQAAAQARLAAVGLTASVQTSAGGTPGRVKAQSPGAGARVDSGSTITITVGAAASSSTTRPGTTTTGGPTSTATTALPGI